MELHGEGSAPEACAAGLFLRFSRYFYRRNLKFHLCYNSRFLDECAHSPPLLAIQSKHFILKCFFLFHFLAGSTVMLQDLPVKCLLRVLGANKISFYCQKQGVETHVLVLDATYLLARLGINGLINSKSSGVYFKTITFVLK